MTAYILSVNQLQYLAYFLLIFITQIYVLRKVILSWYDPLVIFLFFYACAFAFATYLFVDNEIKIDDFIEFTISSFFFYGGLLLGFDSKKISKMVQSSRIDYSLYNNQYKDEIIIQSKQLTVLLWVFMTVALVANLFMLLTAGIALLSENPDAAKVAFRSGGLGIIFRMNDSLIPCCLSIIFIKLFNPIEVNTVLMKNTLVFLLVLTVMIVISSGTKGSITIITGILFGVDVINKLYKTGMENKIKKFALSLLLIGLIITFYIFWKAWIATNDTNVADSMIVRLIGSGDTLWYFYRYNLLKIMGSDALGFFMDSLNPLLSMLRMANYKVPIGTQVMNDSISLDTEGFGGNALHPIVGIIYFGHNLYWLYSLFVGYCVSTIRFKSLAFAINRMTPIRFMISTVIISQAAKLPLDHNMFLESFYSSLLVSIPLGFVVLKVYKPMATTSLN